MGVVLLAVVCALGLQALRVLFPIVFDLFEGTGYARGGMAALAILAVGPLVAPIARRALGDRPALLIAVALLALARIALQIVGQIPLWLSAVTAVIALTAVTLIILGGIAGPPASLVQGLVLGFALDVGIKSAFETWDPPWQGGALPSIVAIALGTAALILAWRSTPMETASVSPLGLIAFGPFLFLNALFVQDPAWVASRSGLGLAATATVILIVDALTIMALGSPDRWSSAIPMGVGLVGVLGLRVTSGPVILIPVALTVWGSATMLVLSLLPGGRHALSREILGGAGGAALFAILVIAYQKDRPLPFSVVHLLDAAAVVLVVLAWLGWRRKTREQARPGRGFAIGPTALLAVPLGLWLAAPATAIQPSNVPATIRLLDYNVHSAVNDQGQVDLGTIAETIEGQQPSVVVLQEVSRGWPIGGMTDVVEWLSRRLGMRYVFVPALDDRFSNAILYVPAMEVYASSDGLLPLGGGVHQRSYLSITFADVGGDPLRVIATHLDGEEDPRSRFAQIEVLLDAIEDPANTVIAGDLNAELGSPELEMFRGFGFDSVQDLTGDRDPTFPQEGEIFDHILLGQGLTTTDMVVVHSLVSDHFPVVATVGRL